MMCNNDRLLAKHVHNAVQMVGASHHCADWLDKPILASPHQGPIAKLPAAAPTLIQTVRKANGCEKVKRWNWPKTRLMCNLQIMKCQ